MNNTKEPVATLNLIILITIPVFDCTADDQGGIAGSAIWRTRPPFYMIKRRTVASLWVDQMTALHIFGEHRRPSDYRPIWSSKHVHDEEEDVIEPWVRLSGFVRSLRNYYSRASVLVQSCIVHRAGLGITCFGHAF